MAWAESGDGKIENGTVLVDLAYSPADALDRHGTDLLGLCPGITR